MSIRRRVVNGRQAGAAGVYPRRPSAAAVTAVDAPASPTRPRFDLEQ